MSYEHYQPGHDPQQQPQYGGPSYPQQPGHVQPWQPQPGQPHPQQWQQPYLPQVAPKHVLGAVIVSFFIPGSGTIYAGEKTWGAVLLALWIISIPLTLITVGFVTGFICWIVGMISAGMAAQKWNREHGIIS